MKLHPCFVSVGENGKTNRKRDSVADASRARRTGIAMLSFWQYLCGVGGEAY